MPFIEFQNISKSYGECHSCRDITISIEKGTIHGIIGENGAGKSTLMKLLGGLTPASSGSIYLENKIYEPRSALDAYKNKIAFIHQHFVLAENLTALDNLVLSSCADWSFFKTQPRKKILSQAQELLKKFNWSIPLEKKVLHLSVGEQQRLEILKSLMLSPDILIFDEPTAVLTPQESSDLLDFILQLKKQNKTIILISHKLNEIKKVCDFVSILRNGSLIASQKSETLNTEQMAEMMIGRRPQTIGNQSTPSKKETQFKLNHPDLEIFKNEVFGVAGVEGNGQSQLIETILQQLQQKKISYGDITEDRLKLSVFDQFTLCDHVLIKFPDMFFKNGLLQSSKLTDVTKKIISQWDVKPGDANMALTQLSGGNQQKFIVGRELYNQPEVLIAAHPTRGVDLGAQEQIHSAFLNYTNSGRTVVLVSSDLDEILSLSDRFVILYKNKTFGPFFKNQLTEAEIGLFMAGGIH